MKNKIFTVLAFVLAFALVGCGDRYESIPAGFTGKILTEQGWQPDQIEAGTVNLGGRPNGIGNKLVLLENTSSLQKETFDVNGNEDKRILLGKVPATVDVYVRVVVPKNSSSYDQIFRMITPVGGDDGNPARILVGNIYDKMAKPEVRNAIRSVLQSKDSIEQITRSLDSVSKEIGERIASHLKAAKVPLELVSVQISNVKLDNTINEAENKLRAVEAQVAGVEKLGEALKSNPQMLEIRKMELLAEMAKTGKVEITYIGGDTKNAGVLVGK